jgi:hypothetical protein
LYGRAGRLTAQNAGFRPGQVGPDAIIQEYKLQVGGDVWVGILAALSAANQFCAAFLFDRPSPAGHRALGPGAAAPLRQPLPGRRGPRRPRAHAAGLLAGGDFITRTPHYESFTMRGAGYNDNALDNAAGLLAARVLPLALEGNARAGHRRFRRLSAPRAPRAPTTAHTKILIGKREGRLTAPGRPGPCGRQRHSHTTLCTSSAIPHIKYTAISLMRAVRESRWRPRPREGPRRGEDAEDRVL